MRLILTILLIGLFKADAQIVINASSPYRPIGGFTGLLDTYSGAAAAYSLRKLDNDYTGNAIRVRKDTTGQPEQDIGFLSSGELDTVGLKSFLNARSGFVVTWYDQSGNARNATQATQANQPRIALSGVIERQNGKPCIFQTTQFLDWTKLNLTLGQAYCIWRSNDAVNMIPFGSTNDAGTLYGAIDASSSSPQANYGTPSYFKNLDSQLANTRISLRNAYIINNIVLSYVTNVGRIATVRSNYTGGGGYNGTNYIFEYVYYENLTDNRTGISTNINTYYSIY